MKVKSLVKAYKGDVLEYHVYKEEYKEPNTKNHLLVLKGKSMSVETVISMWGTENVRGFDIRKDKEYLDCNDMVIIIK